jgi:hypothetical protein
MTVERNDLRRDGGTQDLRAFLALLILLTPALVTAQGRGLTLEQRVQRVEDELAITRILIDYAATQDARDYDAYAALFAKDGEWINGKSVYKGRAAIRKLLVEHGQLSHHLEPADRSSRRSCDGALSTSADPAWRQR